MKNIIKLFGIIALVAVIGFSFTACGDDDDKDDKGGGGTFTLTNIPSEYNGKYVYFQSVTESPFFWGSGDEDGWQGYLVLISNGRASIPVYTGADDGVWWVRFNRTGTFDCFISIANGSYITSKTLVYVDNVSISFTNGNATKSYADFNWLEGYN